MQNERIVASGIYYYDQDNITESSLSFRTAVEEPVEDYGQDDNIGTTEMWGFTRDQPLNQPLGSVLTKQGRSIAFPNSE